MLFLYVCLWLCSLFGLCLLLYLFVIVFVCYCICLLLYLFVIVFVCGFECYELFLVTHEWPALGTWAKEDQKHDTVYDHCQA